MGPALAKGNKSDALALVKLTGVVRKVSGQRHGL
jgi:hypothetical protein